VIATKEDCHHNNDELLQEYEMQCMRFQKALVPNYVDKLEKQHTPFALCLYSEDPKKAYEKFKEYFKIVKAAGGVVVNNEDKLLMIYRNNCWDLPKGKIEASEKTKEAAMREVAEETGLAQIDVKYKIAKTRHVYQIKGEKKRILKITHWYLMFSQDNKLKPQIEEGITKVEWVKKNLVLISHKPSYSNLLDVLAAI
jgi:8-oxo-dGTP pyrophosphatase MutT (NUDIX family)